MKKGKWVKGKKEKTVSLSFSPLPLLPFYPSFFIPHPCLSLPSDYRDARALPDFGFYIELVNEPTRTGQAFAKAAARCESVAHCVSYVGDARPLVLEDKTQARSPARAFGGLSY